MLLEIAIGDAYGAGFEYAGDDFVRAGNKVSAYAQHPTHNIAPGAYTDDAQMSIAIVETLVDGRDWSEIVLADAFVRCFKRDEREGYAGGFYKFLQSVATGKEFLDRISPDSDKSGAAMRAVPIGIFPTVKEVTEKATLQARLTHDTPDGINAAVAAALMGHYFFWKVGAKAELGSFIEKHVAGTWRGPWNRKVGAQGWMSVRAAIAAIEASSSMTELLRTCVAYTGDVDTVAAIACGAASASSEIRQDIPVCLIDGLENGAYGRDFLTALDKRWSDKLKALAS